MSKRSASSRENVSIRWTSLHMPVAKSSPRPFNPRPGGQIVGGSTTDRVFQFLKKYQGVSFRHSELLQHTPQPCTPSALIWACAFLRKHDYIDAYNDVLSGRTRLRYVYTGIPKR